MNRVHAVKTAQAAEALLEQLGIDWELAATARQPAKRDPVVGYDREFYGAATHFIDKKSKAIASFVQETQALVIYDKAKPVAKIFFNELNIRRKGNELARRV